MKLEDVPAIAQKYAPLLMFDLKEPFYPDKVAITVLYEPGPSPSFRRSFDFREPDIGYIVEYAIWWDYEIGHLYELEHVWVYVGQDGSVLDCEVSNHGAVLKGLRKDRSNLIGETQVKLYSQPGKHAFSPIPELFELLPQADAACTTLAGNDGLLVNDMFAEDFSTNDEIDGWVRAYLQSCAFTPTYEFKAYELDPASFTTWDALRQEIPIRIHARIAELRSRYSRM
ncbi:hypothetical protein MKX64_20520 [Paenibacillus sp. FSL M8-0334]|uniref:hypothetical protein n=1 Tax=Paenibacillus sp. FSL M8-0334 TaxID=2921623 RepID=UPI0030FC4664